MKSCEKNTGIPRPNEENNVLKDVQRISLEVLLQVAKVLDNNNIPWFLAYGSCLGAVRHQGFIPWDDDIDIGLLRPDYEHARKILIEKLPSGFTFCDRFTEQEYPYNYAKVRKDHTAYVGEGDMYLHIHHGIGVDLFPFDPCPNDPGEFKKLFRKTKLKRLESDLAHMSFKKNEKVRPFWQLAMISFSRVLFNRNRVQDHLDELIMEYGHDRDTLYVCSWLGAYGEKAKARKEWLLPVKRILFEGYSMPVPGNYEEYLTALYGKYMTLPPEKERVPRHFPAVVSLTEEFNVS